MTAGRFLLPTRGGVASLLAAQIVGLVWPDGARVTLVTVGDQELDLRPFEGVLHGKQVDHLRLAASDAADGVVSAVVEECRLGYSALVVGASATGETDSVVSPFVDAVLGQVSVSAVVVRLGRGHQDRLLWAFGRAIVPVTGSTTSRGSAEVASYLGAAIGTRLHLLYVDTNAASPSLADLTSIIGPPSVGRQILDETAATADKLGANHATELRHAESAGGAILESVTELDADLLVLSAVRRGQVGGSPRFGNTAHFLLAENRTTTIVVVAGESSH
ncbi:MAG: universal stress protein [Actinomycetota bacterium]|nr:universal stress protein [Actinomycetota bacterium]